MSHWLENSCPETGTRYVLLVQQVVGESNLSFVGRSARRIYVITYIKVSTGRLLLRRNNICIFKWKCISSYLLIFTPTLSDAPDFIPFRNHVPHCLLTERLEA